MFDKFAMADKKKEALERQVCQLEWSDNCHKKTQLLQSKPDAMNHIDQWSSGGEGNINTDPNSIKV